MVPRPQCVYKIYIAELFVCMYHIWEQHNNTIIKHCVRGQYHVRIVNYPTMLDSRAWK